jgi:protein TonB
VQQTPDNNFYLVIGLIASLCLHGAALLLTFSNLAPNTRMPVSSLEVTLVNTRTEAEPANAQILAQQNLNAGGNDTGETYASSPLPRTQENEVNEIILEALRKRQAELESEQEQLLTQLISETTTAEPRLRPELFQESPDPGSDDLNRDAQVLNARIAALKARIEAYNSRPRQQFVGPAAQRAAYAQYVEAWRLKIEQIGTEHYPQEARGRIYGSLQLTVYIDRDGTLRNVEINQPSSEPVLNSAARRIVQLAAPFPPLPPDVAAETDILAITRTWHFTNNELTTQ